MSRKIIILAEIHTEAHKTSEKLLLLTSDVPFNDVVLFTEALSSSVHRTGFGNKNAIPVTHNPSKINSIMQILNFFLIYKLNPTHRYIDFGNKTGLDNIKILMMKLSFLNINHEITTELLSINPHLYFNICKNILMDLLILLPHSEFKNLLITKCNLITYDNMTVLDITKMLEAAEKLVNIEIMHNVLLQDRNTPDKNIPFIIITGERHLEDLKLRLSGSIGNSFIIQSINHVDFSDIIDNKNFDLSLDKKYLKYKTKYLNLKSLI
jgi:hypothetical protein